MLDDSYPDIHKPQTHTLKYWLGDTYAHGHAHACAHKHKRENVKIEIALIRHKHTE